MGAGGCNSKALCKQVLRENWQRRKPRTKQWKTLINPSAKKSVKQAVLWPMVFRQLATAAHAPYRKEDLRRFIGASCRIRDIHVYIYFRLPLLQFLCTNVCRCRFCRCSAWLFVTSSDSNLGKVYITGFLKMCSLLWYKQCYKWTGSARITCNKI